MKPNEKAADQKTSDKPGEQKTSDKPGELKRDTQRDGGPRYGGEDWDVAEQRGDNRFGHARNDDADPSELVKRDPDVEDADPSVEAGGEQAGFGKREKPHKPAAREK